MKKPFQLLAILLMMPGTLLASSSSFLQHSVPKQMYHVMGSQAQVQTVSPNGESSTVSGAGTPNNNSAQVKSASVESDSPSVSTTVLASQPANVNLIALEGQIKNLNDMVLLLGQQVEKLRSVQSQLVHGSILNAASSESFAGLWRTFGAWIDGLGLRGYLNVGGLGLLLLLAGFFAGKLRRGKPACVSESADQNMEQSEEAETQAEYDFMGTDEAIPAMLDLARSYLAMDDVAQARAVLEKVLGRCDQVQKQEAQELLNKIGGATA